MNFTRSITRAACAAAILLAATPGARAQFSFTNIADSTSPTFSSFNGRPSINATGTVGFSGGLDAGDTGIFTGNGTTTTIIARTNSGPYSFLTASTINNAGTLGFYALLNAGGVGLFTSNGTTTTTIALSTGVTHGGPTYSEFGFTPAINAGGTLGFRAQLDAGGSGLYTSDGTTTTTIALSNDPTFSNFSSINSINAAGTLGFFGNLDSGDTGIFTSNGTTTTTIALASGSPFSSFGGNAAINSVGRVGFQANLDAGGSGLFTGNGISTTTIALVDPTFLNFQTLSSINTAGMVAFRATLSGGNGLFLGDGTTTTQVIRTGDALFGSTVSLLDVGETGLNDAGQLAFKYTLANGVSGVAVAAAVPEPGSALLLLGGAALLGLRRRR